MNTTVAEEIGLHTIERAAKAYADERAELAAQVDALNTGIEELKRKMLAGIKRAAGRTAEKQTNLVNLVDQARHLFEKPRTVVFHGVKVGLTKGKGTIEFDDEQRVIKLIRKCLATQADTLINTKETVSKTGLKALSVAELKQIGCTVEETGDVVVVRAVDSDVDKIVKALLKDEVEA